MPHQPLDITLVTRMGKSLCTAERSLPRAGVHPPSNSLPQNHKANVYLIGVTLTLAVVVVPAYCTCTSQPLPTETLDSIWLRIYDPSTVVPCRYAANLTFY